MSTKTPETMTCVGSATFRIEGYRIELKWDTQEIADYLGDLRNPNYLDDTEAGESVYSLIASGKDIHIYKGSEFDGVVSPETLSYTMERKIQLEVATQAKNAVFVHAGVVRRADRVIVIPGRTFSGKSSLVYALCQAGCQYYSDEYAVIDSQGAVRPWPRPITLRGNGERTQIPASELNWSPALGPVAARAIVVSRFAEGARWSPHRISPGQAMLALLENTVTARTEPKRALEYLKSLLNAAECLQSDRGDSAETAELLLAHLDTRG